MLKGRMLLLLLFFITTVTWAQKYTVSGTVYSAEGSIPGATVVVKSANTAKLVGTVTDIDGKFNLRVSPNDILTVSFIGYKSKDVAVNGKRELTVKLENSTKEIEQVVVVGYGTQKKASMVASIAQTKGEDLIKSSSSGSIVEALQGAMPGVTTTVGSGKPGAAGLGISIRGRGSWSGNWPLILVDGVERSFSDIDPNEIETISVLKDASATAVFGVKGGNGVILVTTKRGTISKPKVSFSSNFGMKFMAVKPKFSKYTTSMRMWNEALKNDNQWDHLIPESKISAWDRAYEEGKVGPNSDCFPNIDWVDKMTKPGYEQQYNINLRGGTEFVKYFVSLGYLNDGDIYKSHKNELFDPRFYYKKYNWRTNFDLNVTKTTLISINLAGKYGLRNAAEYRIDGGGESSSGYGDNVFFSRLYNGDSNSFPVYWSDGTPGAAIDGSGNLNLAFDMGSRTYRYNEGFYDFKIKQGLGFITKGLSAKLSVSYSNSSKYQSMIQRFGGGSYIKYSRDYDYDNVNKYGDYNYTEKRWPNDLSQQVSPPSASASKILPGGYSRSFYYSTALNYARSFGNHNVSGLFVFNRRESNHVTGIGTMDYKHRQEDWVGRLTYNYKGRYLCEFNGSYDGSESFAPGKRFGFFPSASVGYRISEEPFIKNIAGDFLDNLKVRYSYGQSGKDMSGSGISRFAYIQQYTKGGSAGFGTTKVTHYGPLYHEDKLANMGATWETSTKQNLGIDLKLFNKLTATVDMFKEKRTGILMGVWSPLWLSTSSASGNVGETKNHGAEFELGWNSKIGDKVRYWLKGTYAYSENRIVSRGDGVYTSEYLKQKGKPIGWQKELLAIGKYRSLDDIYNYAVPNNRTLQGQLIPGDFMFVDYNADGLIDAKSDRVASKKMGYPLKTYSFSLGASYKGWSLSALFYGVTDVKKGKALWGNGQGRNGMYKVYSNLGEKWKNGTEAVLHSQYGGYSGASNTYTFQDASYLRLKNIQLSYKFNSKVAEKIKLGSLQVYVNGSNLYTWSNFDKNMDPEQGGVGVYPMVKRVNFGVKASF